MNEFCQNIEIDTLDPDQRIEIPEEILMYAMRAAHVQQAGLSGLETSLKDFTVRNLQKSKLQKQNNAQEQRQTWQRVRDLRNTTIHNSNRYKHLIEILQSQKRTNTDGHDRTVKLIENATVTSNTYRVQQLDVRIITNMLLTRIIGFTGELDQELKNMTVQRVADLIRIRPEIIPPE
ncbi:MAG: hypothetical protein EZS28_003401 [Streblomastix strix]|uniref:Uncharacterized protein n=1 Tax=Streblomastix strix TaxID=222440 RepID=A0A5J4X1M0_9EUKA|nr:MAG: hypothetical protein EZS28_003401 [Streblomastix strix]